MTFGARTLGYLAVNDTIASFTITQGVGTVTGGKGPTIFTFYGWSDVGAAYTPTNGISFADSPFGSASPPTFKGTTILGVTAKDGATSSSYYIYFSGTTLPTVLTLTIGGVLLSTSSITAGSVGSSVFSPAQPAGVCFAVLTPTTTTTSLFTTSGSKTIVIT